MNQRIILAGILLFLLATLMGSCKTIKCDCPMSKKEEVEQMEQQKAKPGEGQAVVAND